MACKQPQEKHRYTDTHRYTDRKISECRRYVRQNGAKMWHSSKVITTFDWLKSISRQRHLMVCECICIYVSVYMYMGVCLFVYAYLLKLHFIHCVCVSVCLDCADKRRYAWNQAKSCLSLILLPLSLSFYFSLPLLLRGPAIDARNRHATSFYSVMVWDEAKVLCPAALFREINFKWVTDVAQIYVYIYIYICI